jgi:hypothetical protein
MVEDLTFKSEMLLVIFSLLLVVFPASTVRPVAASTEATVFVSPANVTVKVNETFQILVKVSDAPRLQGFDFMLTYDSRLLKCLSVEEGALLPSFGPTFVVKREVNDAFSLERGRVWFADVIYGTNFTDGNGTLAVITFNAISIGETLLDLYSDHPFRQDATKLTTCIMEAIPNRSVDGIVTITAASSDGSGNPPPNLRSDPSNDPPSPDINSDGIVDIQDLTIVAVAYGSAEGELKYNAKADLNQDGSVEIQDIAMVAKRYMLESQ